MRVSETFDTKAGYFATLQYDTASCRLLALDNAVDSGAAVLELALGQLTLNGHREHVITAHVTVSRRATLLVVLCFNVVEVLLP